MFEDHPPSPAIALLRRELLVLSRNRGLFGTVAAMTGFLVVATIVLILWADSTHAAMANFARNLFRTQFFLLFATALIVVPGAAAASMVSERRQDCFPLLYTTLIPPAWIVWSKALAMADLYAGFFIGVLPFSGLVYFFTGMETDALMYSAIVLFSLALGTASIGLMASSWATSHGRALYLSGPGRRRHGDVPDNPAHVNLDSSPPIHALAGIHGSDTGIQPGLRWPVGVGALPVLCGLSGLCGHCRLVDCPGPRAPRTVGLEGALRQLCRSAHPADARAAPAPHRGRTKPHRSKGASGEHAGARLPAPCPGTHRPRRRHVFLHPELPRRGRRRIQLVVHRRIHCFDHAASDYGYPVHGRTGAGHLGPAPLLVVLGARRGTGKTRGRLDRAPAPDPGPGRRRPGPLQRCVFSGVFPGDLPNILTVLVGVVGTLVGFGTTAIFALYGAACRKSMTSAIVMAYVASFGLPMLASIPVMILFGALVSIVQADVNGQKDVVLVSQIFGLVSVLFVALLACLVYRSTVRVVESKQAPSRE